MVRNGLERYARAARFVNLGRKLWDFILCVKILNESMAVALLSIIKDVP